MRGPAGLAGSLSRDVDRLLGQDANFGMRLSVALLLAGLVACHRPAPTHGNLPAPVAQPTPAAVSEPAAPSASASPPRGPRPLIGPDWPLARSIPVRATHAAIVSSHPIASDIGIGVLRRGGNAADAAVAVDFVLAVVHPIAGNIGGGGFMLVRTPDGAVHALDFRETAPLAARADMFVDSSGTPLANSVTGALSVGVPGTVAGLFEAHRRFGRLPWRELVAPAESIAREGYTVDAARSRMIGLEAKRLALFAASRAQFLPDDAPPPPGRVSGSPTSRERSRS